ncbi:rhomboid family intramembrane serine protease GlpG [Thalassotalea sp. LPB0316]|uniref:rhomboid family intramembrane serine protease GlpG n=1 Tax=Thalassotalea sp. LPB0316 TaxID=2769490 RepID=UPI00186770B9|nr:rhomboid family intramembrane serine protease GlpG [Thalassotalea sp. LPB0316]QOL26476.1 rhomboid family intramembrane serine protease GlpG [Thalassotalea sp. LPB0316]
MSDHGLTPLVEVNQQNIALIFCDYLKAQEIRAEVISSEAGYVICCQPDAIGQARELFEVFIQNPYDKRYQKAAWHQGQVTELDDNQDNLLTVFKNNFLAHAGPTTLTVFIACWAVYGLSVFGFAMDMFNSLKFYSDFSWSEVIIQPHRLITPALFHFSLLHIAFNTMWWWQLGGAIEKEQGVQHLLLIFIISAVVSNVSQFLVSGPNFGGLSGVVYAVVGYVWFMGYLMPEKGLQLSKPVIGMLLVWLVLGFVDLLPVNVANTAHLTGLISGCVLALLYVNWHKKRQS